MAVRASKKLRSDETLVLSLGSTILRKHLDEVPLWRGEHVPVKQLIEDFARYLCLPRIARPDVLVQAMRDGVALLTWQSDSFAYAESHDEAGGLYRGLHGGQVVTLSKDSAGVLVKPEAARHQMDAEMKSVLTPDSGGGGSTGANAGTKMGGPNGGETATGGGGAPSKVAPRRSFGTVSVDPARAERDAARVAEEVIAHLIGQIDAEVTVTIAIQANLPGGAPDNLVRTKMVTSRSLKFRSHGYESDWLRLRLRRFR